jgi:hypothetical protein
MDEGTRGNIAEVTGGFKDALPAAKAKPALSEISMTKKESSRF